MEIGRTALRAASALAFFAAACLAGAGAGRKPEPSHAAGMEAGAQDMRQESTPPKRYGIVNLPVNYLREAPDYCSPLETQVLMGTAVEIVGESGYWLQVTTPEPYTAWCTNLGITEITPEQAEEYAGAAKYICTAWRTAVMSEPSGKSAKLCDILEGCTMRISAAESRGGRMRAIVKKGFAEVILPDGRKGYAAAADVQEYGRWKETRTRKAGDIIAEAMKYIGLPYMWGGASPNGVDCSGLVRQAFMMNGICLPRNASQQALLGEEIPADRLMPADLLFFGRLREDGTPAVTHVGIYIGDGRFIHASHSVRINSVDPDDEDCYENIHKLLFCRRMPGVLLK